MILYMYYFTILCMIYTIIVTNFYDESNRFIYIHIINIQYIYKYAIYIYFNQEKKSYIPIIYVLYFCAHVKICKVIGATNLAIHTHAICHWFILM